MSGKSPAKFDEKKPLPNAQSSPSAPDFLDPPPRLIEDILSDTKWMPPDVQLNHLDSIDREQFLEHALQYCALFPTEHEFEKETLMQLWLADDTIFEALPHLSVEGTVQQLFDHLCSEGCCLLIRTDVVSKKATYVFNEESQQVRSIRSNSSLTNIVSMVGASNLSDLSPQVTLLSIRCSNLTDSSTLNALKRLTQLRTLLFLQGHELRVKQLPRDLFLSMSHLRSLDLSRSCLTEVPSSLGSLTDLRFLDLSHTLITCLPETIYRLRCLHTLKLKGCSNLCALPEAISSLRWLRHLDLDIIGQLCAMPPRMGYLVDLITLSAFMVGEEEECSIRQLKNMNNLSGSFCISGLENVQTKGKAMEACLSDKKWITKLELQWSDSEDVDPFFSEAVLSSLLPPCGLEELQITCYGGVQVPDWISDPMYFNLVSITLFKFENCEYLPSLGQLPSLRFLDLISFHQLVALDHNFRGEGHGHIAFPRLEKLNIEDMFSLTDWDAIEDGDFPCLAELIVKHCPKLGSFSRLSCLSSLSYLEISHCDKLASFPDGHLPDLETFIIEDCPLVTSLFEDGVQNQIKVDHIPNAWVDHQKI